MSFRINWPFSFYLSKRRLLDFVVLPYLNLAKTVLDPFAGSGIVAYVWKLFGKEVIASDLCAYAYNCLKSVVANSDVVLSDEEIEGLFQGSASDILPKKWFNTKFRKEISLARKNLDNLTGLKRQLASALVVSAALRLLDFHNPLWLKRVRGGIKERVLRANSALGKLLIPGRAKAFKRDAFKLIKTTRVDLVYFDPPYLGKEVGSPDLDFHLVFGDMFESGEFRENWQELVMERYLKRFADRKSAPDLIAKLFQADAKIILYSSDGQSYPVADTKQIIKEVTGKEPTVRKRKIQYSTGLLPQGTVIEGEEYLFIVRR